ncbi:sodium channel regulatory subunit beta-2 isoform X2 [Ambystoma mexicanum]|uniref:sodium channel regulatory subunit beta-2 isoform X2 n=1 Tax=Ambystoma mexicanum TaxID=8296 RepID=UPI0037E77AD1
MLYPGLGNKTAPQKIPSRAYSASNRASSGASMGTRSASGLLALATIICWVPPAASMEITAQPIVTALNGTDARLACTFNSCYKLDNKLFSMNWTYRECENCSEETFITFRLKVINLKLEQFKRMEFTGDTKKNDVSVTIRNVQLEDEGIYNCHVKNPPDRHTGTGKIVLRVVTEVPPERDSTVAVIVGASVGGFLAVVILILVIVKCIRRKKQQKLNTDDPKTDEEGKTDGEGNIEEGSKH